MKNMKYLLLFLLTVISFSGLAQSQNNVGSRGSVRGYVYDMQNKESIMGASVVLRLPADSTMVTGASSDDDGAFRLSAATGKYILEVSFLGYYNYYRNIDITKAKPNLSLDSIFLTENSTLLKDVVVEAKIPDITVKGDTVEYNAGAYLMDEHALLKDLIENIPGAEVDEEGSVKINGKSVNKILIDGKEFFGSDIKTALENLPANMIKKLQLYNKDSETSKITGIKDKDENPVLDLIVKDEFKAALFGNASAGYGTEDRYNANTFINRMGKNTNASFIGNITNSGNGYSMGSGENIRKSVGLNIVHEPSTKLTIEGNVRYEDDTYKAETREESQTFMEQTGDRFGERKSYGDNNNKSFSSDFRIRWNLDSLTMLTFNTSHSLSKLLNNSYSEDFSYIHPDSITAGSARNYTKNDRYVTNNDLNIARNLGKEGRSVSLGMSYSLRKDKGKGTNNSTTQYPDITPDRIIDQQLNTNNDGHTLRFSFSYNEPVAKDKILSLSYSYQHDNSERINDTRKQDPLTGEYNVVDSAYARNTKNVYTVHDIRLQFQSGQYNDPWFYSVSFGLNPTVSKNKVNLLDSLIEDLKQRTLNYSPELTVRRNFSEKSNMSLRYLGSTSQPGLMQLSADTIIYNALSKQVGNPDLKMTFRNNLSLDYYNSDFESGRMFMAMGSFSYTFNDIITDRVIDTKGNSISTYRNVDGQMSSYGHVMFNTPLKNKKFNVSVNTNVNYNKYIGYTNGDKSITNSYSFGGGGSFSFVDKKFKNYFRTNLNYRKSNNNLTKQQSIENTILNISNRTTWNLPNGFAINNNLNYTYRWGFGPDYQKSEIIWNPSVSKKILKGDKGLIQIEAFDILNERTNLSRYENSMGITQTWTNGISQYFMFSFSYRFQTSGSGGSGAGMNMPSGHYNIY